MPRHLVDAPLFHAVGRLVAVLKRLRWIFVACMVIAVAIPIAAYAHYGRERTLPAVATPIAFALFHVFSWSGLALLVIACFDPVSGVFAQQPQRPFRGFLWRALRVWAVVFVAVSLLALLLAAIFFRLGT